MVGSCRRRELQTALNYSSDDSPATPHRKSTSSLNFYSYFQINKINRPPLPGSFHGSHLKDSKFERSQIVCSRYFIVVLFFPFISNFSRPYLSSRGCMLRLVSSCGGYSSFSSTCDTLKAERSHGPARGSRPPPAPAPLRVIRLRHSCQWNKLPAQHVPIAKRYLKFVNRWKWRKLSFLQTVESQWPTESYICYLDIL